MRKKFLHILLVILIVLIQIGCSSLDGRYVDNDVPEKIEVASGISYYLTQPTFEIQRKTTKDSKKAEPVYDLVIGGAPDPKRRFEVGMNQGWFSSDTFELNLTEDARVKSITGSSADQTARVIASLGVLAAEVAGAIGTGGTSLLASTLPTPEEEDKEIKKIFEAGRDADLIESKEFETAKCYIDHVNKIDNNCVKPSDGDYIKIADKLKEGLIKTNTVKFTGIKTRVKILEETDLTGIPHQIVEESASVKKTKEKTDTTGIVLQIKPVSVKEAEKNVLNLYDWIKKVDETIVKAKGSTPPIPTAVEAISKIKKELDVAIAKTLKDPANRPEMLAKAKQFRDAVSLVVEADEKVNNRGLSTRRAMLSDFLKQPIPKGANGNVSKGYLDFASQLDKVMTAINSLIGSSTTESPESLPLATEITSRATRNIFVYRWDKELKNEELNEELNEKIKLAQARVLYGESEAVVITFPSGH